MGVHTQSVRRSPANDAAVGAQVCGAHQRALCPGNSGRRGHRTRGLYPDVGVVPRNGPATVTGGRRGCCSSASGHVFPEAILTSLSRFAMRAAAVGDGNRILSPTNSVVRARRIPGQAPPHRGEYRAFDRDDLLRDGLRVPMRQPLRHFPILFSLAVPSSGHFGVYRCRRPAIDDDCGATPAGKTPTVLDLQLAFTTIYDAFVTILSWIQPSAEVRCRGERRMGRGTAASLAATPVGGQSEELSLTSASRGTRPNPATLVVIRSARPSGMMLFVAARLGNVAGG